MPAPPRTPDPTGLQPTSRPWPPSSLERPDRTRRHGELRHFSQALFEELERYEERERCEGREKFDEFDEFDELDEGFERDGYDVSGA